MTEELGVAADLARGYELAASLLDPVLSGEVAAAVWVPEAQGWRSTQPGHG